MNSTKNISIILVLILNFCFCSLSLKAVNTTSNKTISLTNQKYKKFKIISVTFSEPTDKSELIRQFGKASLNCLGFGMVIGVLSPLFIFFGFYGVILAGIGMGVAVTLIFASLMLFIFKLAVIATKE